MSSLSDQLLKAGLVTQEQVKKATEKPKKKFHKANNKKTNQPKNVNNKLQQRKKEQSDLAKFYNERSKVENQEKQEAHRKKQEAARLKKAMNTKVNALISSNMKNDESAEIRYNFVVGTTIKYVFVTEEQQQELSDRKLAITFWGGKRCLIPADIADQVLEINPDKIVILASID